MCEGGRGLASIGVKVQTKVRYSCSCAMSVFLVLAADRVLKPAPKACVQRRHTRESQNVPLKKGDLHVLNML